MVITCRRSDLSLTMRTYSSTLNWCGRPSVSEGVQLLAPVELLDDGDEIDGAAELDQAGDDGVDAAMRVSEKSSVLSFEVAS